MKTTTKKTSLGLALMATLALSIPLANAQLVPPMDGIEVNLVGIGAGGAPDYMGSSHNKIYPAIAARYQFEGSQRYFVLLGPQAQLNILDDQNWRFGPQITYRGGRGSDVDNSTVKQMQGINGAVEGGVFVTYRMPLSNNKMHQINFTADIAGGSNGTIGGLKMMWFQPISQQTIFNLGAGVQYASDKWMDTYFSVKNAHDIALFPTLRGQAFNAGSGVKGFNIPFGVSHFIDKQWILSLGGRYEKLNGDAKDSPVTSIVGKDNQWIYGAMVSYVF